MQAENGLGIFQKFGPLLHEGGVSGEQLMAQSQAAENLCPHSLVFLLFHFNLFFPGRSPAYERVPPFSRDSRHSLTNTLEIPLC